MASRRIADPLAGVKVVSDENPQASVVVADDGGAASMAAQIRQSEKNAQVPSSLPPTIPVKAFTVRQKTRVCFRGQIIHLHPGVKYSDAIYGDGAIESFRASRAELVEVTE